jgi:hypothetical protein
MVGARNPHERYTKCMQHFAGKLTGRDRLEDPDVGRRIVLVLKRMLKR